MIKIEIDDREVHRALTSLQARLGDLTPVMQDIGEVLTEGSRERILAGGDWAGRPFAPNSAATLARKKGGQPLIDSKSFVRTRLHYEAGRDQVEVGSSAVQAAVLQFGARKGAFGTDRRSSTSPASASRRRGTGRNVMQARALAG
ncbi:MAG: phage virion morphogenesis protein [Stenotrophomonas sp.]|nr:phage virion morphogenesis protein [Xanthomonadales bacterium]MBN8768366.1 phage virion morphogenesis protein [Stenotrophomonas sp.]